MEWKLLENFQPIKAKLIAIQLRADARIKHQGKIFGAVAPISGSKIMIFMEESTNRSCSFNEAFKNSYKVDANTKAILDEMQANLWSILDSFGPPFRQHESSDKKVLFSGFTSEALIDF